MSHSLDRETCIKYEHFFQLVTQSVKVSNQISSASHTLSPVVILVFESFILTFHFGTTANIIPQLEMRNQDITPDRLLILIFQDIFDFLAPFSRYNVSQLPIFRELEVEADRIDDIILVRDSHDQRETLKRIHASLKTVTIFLKMTATKAILLRSFMKKRGTIQDGDIFLHLESLEDRAKAISSGLPHLSNYRIRVF